jgi:uncharacterized membrane protein YgaE (UPF0421/DUF939 family)
MKIIGTRTIKTGLGVTAAIMLAAGLGLKYSAAAGIIAMLSIQSTKRESIQIALQRMAACLMALALASLFFNLLGFSPVVFGVFLLTFIPLTVKFNLEQGIVVSSVIATHLLAERSTSVPLILNELGLMAIGVSIALILNLYMPSIENRIKEDQKQIEEGMKGILMKMAAALRENDSSFCEEKLFGDVEEWLRAAKTNAYRNLNNYLISDMSYYVEYTEMRRQQFKTLKRMKESFRRFFIAYDQTLMVADFTEKVSGDFCEQNTCEDLLMELEALRGEFREMDLPATREEFENRAMLFQFLNDLEQFLTIKREFMKSIEGKNLKLKG